MEWDDGGEIDNKNIFFNLNLSIGAWNMVFKSIDHIWLPFTSWGDWVRVMDNYEHFGRDFPAHLCLKGETCELAILLPTAERRFVSLRISDLTFN